MSSVAPLRSRHRIGARAVALLLCSAGLVALAGCEESAPQSASYAAPPPPPPAPAPSATPGDAAPGDSQTPPAVSAQPAPTDAAAAAAGSSTDFTMAPIANPPERHTAHFVMSRHAGHRHPLHKGVHHAVATAAKPHPAAPPAKAKAAAPTAAPSTQTAAATTVASTRSGKLDAVQAALVSSLTAGAVLSDAVPGQSGQDAKVTLTLGADLADKVRKAAEGQGLITQGAPITVSAGLAAEGYTLNSPAVQTTPLNISGPSQLAWTVSPHGAAHQPMQVNVCVQLPSGDPQVCGGPVEGPQATGDSNARLFGFLLIAAAIAAITALVLRNRARDQNKKKPVRSADNSGVGF